MAAVSGKHGSMVHDGGSPDFNVLEVGVGVWGLEVQPRV